jgi:hypothetical protein
VGHGGHRKQHSREAFLSVEPFFHFSSKLLNSIYKRRPTLTENTLRINYKQQLGKPVRKTIARFDENNNGTAKVNLVLNY